jgi:hypothetical protein
MRTYIAVAIVLVAAATMAASTGAAPRYAGFSARVDNRWFPLLPGTRYLYIGAKDGLPSRDVVTVSHRVRTIAGARCVTVEDRLYLRGRLRERTTDWYSQDRRGNVWYFGERTAELAHGHITSREGTWTAGIDGARPGIYIPADPRVGQSGRQEFYKGHAEDHFKVIGRFKTLVGGTVANAVLTEEWTPLEPGTLDHKLYLRGVGTVLEHTERGGDEHAELIAVTH